MSDATLCPDLCADCGEPRSALAHLHDSDCYVYQAASDGALARLHDAQVEIARLSRLNGRRERQIARARLQEEGVPCTPEWITSVEMIYTEARVTQRVCSALRRAWVERDALASTLEATRQENEMIRAFIDAAPHGADCSARWHKSYACSGPCDCWKSRALEPETRP